MANCWVLFRGHLARSRSPGSSCQIADSRFVASGCAALLVANGSWCLAALLWVFSSPRACCCVSSDPNCDLMRWQRRRPMRCWRLTRRASWHPDTIRRHPPKRLASWLLDALRCLELVAAWLFAAGLSVTSWPPLHSVELMAAGHNSGLQPPALAFCWLLPRRHPWLRVHCTAAAGRGIIMGVSVVGWAAAETKRYAAPYFWGIGFDLLSGYCVRLPVTGDVVPWSVRSGGLTASDARKPAAGWAAPLCQCVLASWQVSLRGHWMPGAARSFGAWLADTGDLVPYLMCDSGLVPSGCVAALHR